MCALEGANVNFSRYIYSCNTKIPHSQRQYCKSMFSVVVDIMTRTILATKTPPSIISSYLLAHLPAGPFNIKQTSKQEKKQPKIYKK